MAARKKTTLKRVKLAKPFYVESGPEDYDPDFSSMLRVTHGPTKAAGATRFKDEWDKAITEELEASGYTDAAEVWTLMYDRGWDFEEVEPSLHVSVP
jgi:hypothetical protein